MGYYGSKILAGQVNSRTRVVAIPSTTAPVTYIGTNLDDSLNTTGGTISVVGFIGLKLLCIAKNNPLCMIACLNSASTDDVGVYSKDGGQTWTAVPYTSSYVFGAAISDDGSAMFITRSYATYSFWYSYNRGTTWSAKTTGLTAINPNYRGPAINSTGTFGFWVNYNSAGAVSVYTTNSGATWIEGTLPWTATGVCTDSAGSIVWISKYIAAGELPVNVAYSTNFGSSWTTVTVGTGAVNTGINLIKCSSNGAILIVAASSGDCYISTDAGANWAKTTATPETVDINTLTISADGKNVAFASSATNGRYFVSSDNGSSWVTHNFSGVSFKFGTLAIQ